MEGKFNLNSINFFENVIGQIKKANTNIPLMKKPLDNQGLYNSKLINEEDIDFEKESDFLGEDVIELSNLRIKNEPLLKPDNNQPFPSTKSNNNKLIKILKTDEGKNLIKINRLEGQQLNLIKNNSVVICNMPKMMTERKLKDIASNYGKVISLQVKLFKLVSQR
jgi:hypothetical protein